MVTGVAIASGRDSASDGEVSVRSARGSACNAVVSNTSGISAIAFMTGGGFSRTSSTGVGIGSIFSISAISTVFSAVSVSASIISVSLTAACSREVTNSCSSCFFSDSNRSIACVRASTSAIACSLISVSLTAICWRAVTNSCSSCFFSDSNRSIACIRASTSAIACSLRTVS